MKKGQAVKVTKDGKTIRYKHRPEVDDAVKNMQMRIGADYAARCGPKMVFLAQKHIQGAMNSFRDTPDFRDVLKVLRQRAPKSRSQRVAYEMFRRLTKFVTHNKMFRTGWKRA